MLFRCMIGISRREFHSGSGLPWSDMPSEALSETPFAIWTHLSCPCRLNNCFPHFRMVGVSLVAGGGMRGILGNIRHVDGWKGGYGSNCGIDVKKIMSGGGYQWREGLMLRKKGTSGK
jgi:hypothetical protein